MKYYVIMGYLHQVCLCSHFPIVKVRASFSARHDLFVHNSSIYIDVRNFRIKKIFKKTSIEIIKTIWMFISLTIEFLNEANNYSGYFDKNYDATN